MRKQHQATLALTEGFAASVDLDRHGRLTAYQSSGDGLEDFAVQIFSQEAYTLPASHERIASAYPYAVKV